MHAAIWRKETQAELAQTQRAKSVLDCQYLAGLLSLSVDGGDDGSEASGCEAY